MISFNKKGQSSVEYAMLIVIAIGALLTISVYFKRGVQGRWKTVVDDMGDQYDPRYANSSVIHSINSNVTTSIETLNTDGGFWTRRTDDTNMIERKTGFITVGDVSAN